MDEQTRHFFVRCVIMDVLCNMLILFGKRYRNYSRIKKEIYIPVKLLPHIMNQAGLEIIHKAPVPETT